MNSWKRLPKKNNGIWWYVITEKRCFNCVNAEDGWSHERCRLCMGDLSGYALFSPRIKSSEDFPGPDY